MTITLTLNKDDAQALTRLLRVHEWERSGTIALSLYRPSTWRQGADGKWRNKQYPGLVVSPVDQERDHAKCKSRS